MAFLSPELSVGELTLLLFAIVLALIPLTIWALCNHDGRSKPDGWIRREQKSIKARIG